MEHLQLTKNYMLDVTRQLFRAISAEDFLSLFGFKGLNHAYSV